jgi:hypothetical protein
MMISVAGLVLALAIAQQLDADDSGRHTETAPSKAGALGVTAGFPLGIGLSAERAIAPNLSVGICASTLIFAGSFGGRLVLGPIEAGFNPRFGLGVLFISALYQEDEDDPEGTAAYGWPSIGFAWRGDNTLLAGEAGWLFTGNRDAGLGLAGSLDITLSMMFRF